MKKDSAASTEEAKNIKKTSYESRGRRRARLKRRLLILGIFSVILSAAAALSLYRPSVWEEAGQFAVIACGQMRERFEGIDWDRLWRENPILAWARASREAAATPAGENKAPETGAPPEESSQAGQGQAAQVSLEELKQSALTSGVPADIVALLDKNAETRDFVQNYNQKKDAPPSEEPLVLNGEALVPRLVQWDERWGYQPYGPGCMALNGCGPTCMSMVIAGLTGDTSATPYRLAVYATEHGLIDQKRGATSWALMTRAAKDWGLTVTSAPPSEELIKQELNAGHPIICRMGPGAFTNGGHFIVLTSYLDGYITLNDSFSIENSSKFWLYSDIADQISQIWIYSAE